MRKSRSCSNDVLVDQTTEPCPCQKFHSDLKLGFRHDVDGHQHSDLMALSFLYQAFCRLLGILRRWDASAANSPRRSSCWYRKSPSCDARPQDRRCNPRTGPSSPIFGGCSPSPGDWELSSSRRRCWAGIETSCAADGHTRSLPRRCARISGPLGRACQRYWSAGTHSPWLRNGSRSGRWITASADRRPRADASST